MEEKKGPKRLVLDSLIENVSLGLKDVILLITIVLTIAGSAWYYRDKINSLEEKVQIIETSTLVTKIAVMETKVNDMSNRFADVNSELDSLTEDFNELEKWSHNNNVPKSRFNKVLKKIKITFDNIQKVTIPFKNELE